MKRKAVIFDIDRTLSRKYLILELGELVCSLGLSGNDFASERKRKLEDYSKGRISYIDAVSGVVEAFGKCVEGVEREAVRSIGKKYITSHPEIKFDYVDKLISYFSEMEYIQASISGSPSEIVLPFTESLGIENSFPTEFEVVDGIYTGRISKNRAGGKGRIGTIKDFMEENNIDPEQSAVFEDSISGIPLLEMVGHPVVVNHEKEMEDAAKSKGWLICREGEDVVGAVTSYLEKGK